MVVNRTIKRRMLEPTRHLRWILFAKIVNSTICLIGSQIQSTRMVGLSCSTMGFFGNLGIEGSALGLNLESVLKKLILLSNKKFYGDYLFSRFAKFSETFNISYPLIRTCMSAYQGVRNVSFSEYFANVLNE